MTRGTFKGELNYQAGKIFYLPFIALVGCLFYIPIDTELHQFSALSVAVSVGFSIVSAAVIAMRFTKTYRYRADIPQMILAAYFCVSVALEAGTGGQDAGLYILGLVLAVTFVMSMPFPLAYKMGVYAAALSVFFISGAASGLDFGDMKVMYALADLSIWGMICVALCFSQDRMRFNNWKSRQNLIEMIKKSDENAEIIAGLADKAESSSHAKNAFLAKMSHEIRTPLNAIIGMTELALRSSDQNAIREHNLTIKQASATLLSIVNDILDFSKIEAGKLEIVKSGYLFSSMINDVISIIRMRAVDKEIRFVVNIDNNIPKVMYGDEMRIRQIFLNILDNAVKYTKQGFVSLTIYSEMTDEDTANLIIEVMDSGNGIKDEDIDKMFGEFIQLDLDVNKGIVGTGLGLAIAQSFLKAMGGTINVRSRYGKGSTFNITLPQSVISREKLASIDNAEGMCAIVYELRDIYANSIICTVDNLGIDCDLITTDDELVGAMLERSYNFIFISYEMYKKNKDALSKFKKNSKIILVTGFGESVSEKDVSVLSMPVYSVNVADIINGVTDHAEYNTIEEPTARFIAPRARILVVDDVRTNLKVAQGLLSPYKVKVDVCEGGAEAIEKVKATRYDLLLLDHMMPGMDGLETTARIRALEVPDCRALPIIALTAHVMSGIRESFLAGGFDDFLSKPIDLNELNAVLEKWLPKEKQLKDDTETLRKNTAGMIEIAGVDVAKGLMMAGGEISVYYDILTEFCHDADTRIAEIRASLERDDTAMYTICVHALKGAAANIGADYLYKTSETLELAGKRADLRYIGTHTPSYLAELENLSGNIKAMIWMARVDAVSADKNEDRGGGERLSAVLRKFRKALCDFDAEGVAEFSGDLREWRTGETGEIIEEILRGKLVGDYDGCISLIDSLLQGQGAALDR